MVCVIVFSIAVRLQDSTPALVLRACPRCALLSRLSKQRVCVNPEREKRNDDERGAFAGSFVGVAVGGDDVE